MDNLNTYVHVVYCLLQLIRQRAFLRDERRFLREAAADVEDKNKALQKVIHAVRFEVWCMIIPYCLLLWQMRRTDWLPAPLTVPPERHIRINVGGLVSESVLIV
jgi:hypothetical protein